jgi:hypothetical protein
MRILGELQNWYESNCNGGWETAFGVKIDTLSNPGWSVTIDLSEKLASRKFKKISSTRSERDWIRCWVEGGKFFGAGGPAKLEEIIQVFLNWTKNEAS